MAPQAGATSSSVDLAAVLEAQLRADTLRVPPYPAVATQLQRMVSDEHFGITEVSRVVSADASLAAMVLRRANAADMVGNGSASSLGAAVFRVGVDTVIRMAMAATVGAAAMTNGPLAALRRDVWRRSLFSALACQEVARRRGVPPEHAFVAGLLHDFGEVVVLSTLEALAGERKLPVMPADAWRKAVQQFHVPVGIAVARRWQLPELVTSVIAHHHQPGTSPKDHFPVVELVAVIDHAIAMLDRAPERGVTVLSDVPGLRNDERELLGKIIPVVAGQMAQYETEPPTQQQPSGVIPLVAAPPPVAGMTPVDFAVDVKGTTTLFRATHISDALLAVVSRGALKPGWMATITLKHGDSPLMVLATVQTCEPGVGGHVSTLQPFGLADGDRKAWQRIVTTSAAAPRVATPHAATTKISITGIPQVPTRGRT